MRLGLAGPSNIPYSVSADSQRTVNLFPELIPGGRGKAAAVLYGTPGLTTRVELSSSNGIKALFYDTATKRTFAVKRTTAGAVRLSELTTTTALADTETDRGQLLSSGGTMVPASISSSGTELLIICPETNKAFGFVLATNALTDITSEVGEGSPAWATYLDGYFIALDRNGKFYLSGINDVSTWDATDVATPESSPDTATMLVTHRGFLWVFGSDSVEIWRNTGDVDFPFAPIKYQTIRTGLLFTYSVALIENSLFWVSRSASGPATIVEARGPEPHKISSNAVTASIQEKVVGGAAPVAWTHQHLGHSFYVLTFPDDNLTWAYDTELGKDMGWHERMYLRSGGSWDAGIAGPIGETIPLGVAVKANGDIVLVGTDSNKVYTYSNGSWDAGIAGPIGETRPYGLAVKANGDILLAGDDTNKVYTYSGGVWDAGIAGPIAESSPSGLAVKANGDLVLVGTDSDRVYTYSGGSWDAGIAGPIGETNPHGVAVKANGDILLVGVTTDKVYTYSNGSWDAGIAVPSAESSPTGLAVKANGDIVLVGVTTNKVYTFSARPTEEAHRGRCCAFVGGEDGAASAHLVGDRGNGKIYAMSMSAYSDAGVAIKRIRRAQHISDEMKQLIFHGLPGRTISETCGAMTGSSTSASWAARPRTRPTRAATRPAGS